MMKRKLLLLLALIAIGLSHAWAYDFSSVAPSGQTLYYNIVGGNAQVTYYYSGSPSYPDLTGALVIPATVTYNSTTYSVTIIGDYAFWGCSGLTSVTIPNSVTSIGGWAFQNCSSLTSVTIGNSVTTIGGGAFDHCSVLTSVTIPNSVTSIESSAFYNCSGLTSVTIPNSVTSIGDYVFYNCSGLTSVTIPNSVTSIGNSAFYNCSGLTGVTIPNSVTSIGNYAFYGCSNVDTLYYNARNLTTTNEWGNSSSSYNSYGFRPMTLKHLVIGDSVQTLPDYVFLNQDSLTSVTIPNSVTSIGDRAFYNCSGLTSVIIPNLVTSIEDYTFYGCSGLTSVTIPNSVTSIGSSAFYGCSNVDTLYYNAHNLTTTIYWGYSLSNYNSYGFRPMKLKHLVIGDSVQTLPENVFYNQDSLTSVTIPNSVTSIRERAFYGCSNVDTLYYNARNLTTWSVWGNSSSSYNSYGFRPMTLKHLVIGDSVQTLPNDVFYNQDSLTSVTIPNSVTSIGTYAFYGCSGLTSVTIPNSVTTIGDNTFYGCSGLTSVTIPNSVTSIGWGAFYNCSGLTSVTLEGVTPPTLGSYVFGNNAPNRKIYVPCGAYDNYYNANNGWSDYRNYLSDPIVDIDVTVNAESGKGSASIIQNVRCDSTIVVTATPNYGYHFDHWSTGSTQTQDTIAIEGDTMITAYFAKNQYAINVVSDNMDMGNVFGSDTIDYLDSITISAIANYGYHFTRWNDNDTHQVRTVQVTQNKTYTAYFDYNQYQLTVASANTVQGSCSGSGAYNYLSNRNISATANYGYHFTQWSDGNTDNPRIIQLTQDTLFTAEFAKNQYAVNVVSSDTVRGYVTGSDTIDYLDSITISTVANYGYHFTRWNDNDTHQVRNVQVTQNKTYTAYFDYNQYQLTVAPANTIEGSVSGSGTYNYLSNRTISATANYGYHFTQWSDGNTANPRTIQLTQDTLFTAEFAKNQYVINVISNNTDRGSVFGSDTIDYLDSITISAIANYGYHFTRWNDNDTHQVRTVQVTQNKTYTAYFDYNQYQLTAASADTVQGTCSGSGAYSYLANRTIQATANYGYHFTQWNDGNTENPRTIQLTQDTIFTAEFAKNQYEITAVSDDESLGMVSGGGIFDYLDTVILTATTTAEHHHFVRWSDGNRENPRQYVVTEDKTLTAYFAVDTHSVAVVSNDPTRGMVTSSGSEFEYLSPCTVTATAYTGFVFTGWSNGVTANPYTFAVQSDVELTAIFVSEDELMFTITVETDDPTMGSVSGGGMAMSGGEVTIHAVANEGYHFVRWNDNNTNADRTVIVTEDATYTAYFAADQTEGIDEVEQMPTIVVRGNSIAVGNAQGQKLSIYDITGRIIVREQAVDGKQYTMPHSGVYMVQVGNHPAEKVVVIR